ncbi:MAG TPA: TIGR02186 family protein [Candidatus Cybelea sp.]|nr:TIGR02186 family protein [Candidatus Cybelea sp.]
MGRRFALVALVLLATPAARAQENPLITDLSSHLISITSSFTGTELLLFGATEEPGDVIVVVRGPPQAATVRHKARIAGIWVNRESVRFSNVPGYYAVAASRPLDQIASPGLLSRLQIGTENLRLAIRSHVDETEQLPYREALVRGKVREELFQDNAGHVVFLGPKLFRVRIGFPATVPVGTYQAEVYLLRDDQVISAQATPLFINKSGAEREIYDFAHEQPAAYGVVAVSLSIIAGWLAATLLRRT